MAANTSSGWNRPSGAAKPVQKKSGSSSLVKGVVAGLLVCVGALAAFYLVNDSATHPKTSNDRNRRIAEVKPSAPRKVADEKVAAKTVAPEPKKSAKVERAVAAQPEQATVLTNDTTVATNKPKKVKRVFKSQMEMFLNMAIPTRPGERMPPVPLPDSDENADEETQIENVKAELADIEKGFKNELKIKEGDSEALAERKAIVTDAKAEFRELMKDGMTLKQYIKALQDKFNADADFVGEAQKMVDENYNDQNLSNEDYQKLKEKVDKLLQDRGLPATEDEDTLAAKEAEAEQSKTEQEKK